MLVFKFKRFVKKMDCIKIKSLLKLIVYLICKAKQVSTFLFYYVDLFAELYMKQLVTFALAVGVSVI